MMAFARRLRLLRSLTFRIALIYVTLFLSSTVLLLGAAYWISIVRPMTIQADRVHAEVDQLKALDAREGRGALVTALEKRLAGPSGAKPFHALIGAAGKTVTANLPSWPRHPIDGVRRLEADLYVDGAEEDYEAIVMEHRLSDGARLIIGRDVEGLDDREEIFINGSAWFILVAGLLAIGGSIAMSMAVASRIEAMSRTARRVILGELSERIPIRGTEDDFDMLATTLNVMLDRIQELVESVRRVSDNIAHELRTPLARLQADLDEVRTARTSKERLALVEQALGEASRLRSVFDALLRIARIESGRHLAGIKRIDLAPLLRDAVEFHLPGAEEKGLSVTTRIAGTIPIDADPDLMFQAVSNLLDNSIKYGAKGGDIILSAWQAHGHSHISLIDNGPGIPPEHRSRVTERFYRVPETDHKAGAGLGLSLVAAVIALHRGTFTLADADPGTRADIVL